MVWIVLGWTVGVIISMVLLLLTIAVVRTLCIKPTKAMKGTINYKEPERAMEYARKLSRMIQCETVSNRYENDLRKFHEFHKVLEELYPLVHARCERVELEGNLLYCLKGKGTAEPILLMSHQDVVEATGTWEEEPFGGAIKDGILWGRGTVDTKGSLSCIFQAIEEVIAEGFTPEGDVYIASSCTEEFSGDGAPTIVRYLKSKGVRLALLLDEGGMITEEPIGGVKGIYAMVGVLEKGYGDLKFIARGKGGHASAPGKNTPLVRLSKFVCDIEKKQPFQRKFNPTVREMFKRLSPNTSFGLRLVFSNLWLFQPLLKRVMIDISPNGAAMLQTTMAFTTAKGSNGLNVLPQEAYVTGNMRFIPHQPNEESIAIVKKKAAKYGLETEIIYQDAPCPVVDYKTEAFRQVERVIEQTFPGVGIVPYAMTGGTDAKFYIDICDNCIRFAPLYVTKQQLSSIHGLNENINIEVLPGAVDFYKAITSMRHQI